MSDKNNIKCEKIQLKTLINYMKNSKEREDKRFCFILGAGASRQSGIPTGKDLAEKWIKEIENLYNKDEIIKWKEKNRITEENIAQNYSTIYEKRFELDSDEGCYYLENEMEGIEPSFGYSVLVQILANSKNNIVITTNFDSLVEDAMFMYTNKKPLVCGHEALTGFIKPIMSRPLIAKIHRDLFLDPKNSNEETNNLSSGWDKALDNILKFYTPIVIGYGGNDGSLMGFLENIKDINGRIFWCYWNGGQEPEGNIQKLVSKHNGYLVPIDGFDEMFIQLNEIFGYEPLDEQIVNIAKLRSKKYKNQFEELSKKTIDMDTDTSTAFKSIINRRHKDWWSAQLEINSEDDIDKQEELYNKAIEEFPESHELIGNYALFLHETRKEYDKAEEYYKKVLEIDPRYVNYLGNYANFSCEIREDYNKAEEYYKQALEIEPEHANNLGNYAEFLYKIKKDHDKAEVYYKKSLENNPIAYHLGYYAKFLEDIRKDYDKAEAYYKKALEIEPKHVNNLKNYKLFLQKIGKWNKELENLYKEEVAISEEKKN